MFDFNFLSKKEQTQYRRWVWLQHTSIGLFLVAVLLIAAAAVIVVGRYSADALVTATTNETALLQDSQKRLSSTSTAETQRTLQQLNTIQSEHFLYLNDLSSIYATAGEGVRLTNVDLNYEAAELALSGTAETRENFIAFQEQLDGLENFSLTTVPLDLLAQPSDITFRLTLLIKDAE